MGYNSYWCRLYFASICTVVGRWVRQRWLILFFVCKWNSADTNLCSPYNRPYVFSLLSQIPIVSIQVLVVSVKLEWCQQLFTRCLCWPIGKEEELSAPLGDSDMEKSLLWIIHIINLTPNLTELCPLSAALALFTLTMTKLNYSGSLQLSAHMYRPIQKHIAGLCSPFYWNRHLLSSITHSSLCFTFIWLSPPFDFPSFLSAFHSLSLSNHVHSNTDTFYNSSLLSVSASHLH